MLMKVNDGHSARRRGLRRMRAASNHHQHQHQTCETSSQQLLHQAISIGAGGYQLCGTAGHSSTDAESA
jgi:hypothetical protein